MNTKSLLPWVAAFVAGFLTAHAHTYQSDLKLVSEQTQPVELTDKSGEARLLVTPEFQGRVLVGSFGGLKGSSVGWINREAFQRGDLANGGKAGGLDRLWIGPLGGQYSFYYQQIKPLNGENWKVPASFGEAPYEVVSQSDDSIRMEQAIELTNFVGTRFQMVAEREIRMIVPDEAEQLLDLNLDFELSEMSMVAFESKNQLVNTGSKAWKAETGIPSVWSLGMIQGTPGNLLFYPLKDKSEMKQVRTYLSPANSDRLWYEDGFLFYRADGCYRNKLGMVPSLAGRLWGTYDEAHQVLILIRYHFDPDQEKYFNSYDTVQEHPYDGDPVHIYNNGPMDLSIGDAQTASFYELETTAASYALEPGERASHWHQVFVLRCSKSGMKQIMDAIRVD